jgi:hypothetical protein
VSESRLVFLREGNGDSFAENKFSRKVLANNARKRQNFKAGQKEEDEEIQQQQVWRKLISLSLSEQDADIERGGCVRELDD